MSSFDQEAAIDSWRRRLEASGIDAAHRDELEDHLRSLLDELQERGYQATEAFATAAQRVGAAESLADELERAGKARTAAGRRPLGSRSVAKFGDDSDGPLANGTNGGFASGLRGDIAFSLRLLRRNALFAAVAVVALAFGIGSTTAIFSVVQTVLLASLPYENPEDLYLIEDAPIKLTPGPMTLETHLEWADRVPAFAELAAYHPIGGSANLTGDGGEPTRARINEVTPSLFEVLRVRMLAGRGFFPEEMRPGNNQVAVISEALFHQRYGSDESIVGSTILLNGHPFTVVGVLPEGFAFPVEGDIWVPEVLTMQEPILIHGARFFYVIGRLAPGASAADAAAQAADFSAWLAAEFEGRSLGRSVVRPVPLRDHLVGDSRQTLIVVMGCVGLALLLTCANLANFLLSRTGERAREYSVRAALGGSRWRLARQSWVESLVLATLAGLVGFAFASWSLSVFVAGTSWDLPRLGEIEIDGVAMAVTFLLSLATATVFGSLPAYSASRANLTAAIKSGALGARHGRIPVGDALVVVQIALALTLLGGAGLLVRSYTSVHRVDAGFDPGNVLSFAVTLSDIDYPDAESRVGFFTEAVTNLQQLPGVRAAASANFLAMAEASGFSLPWRIGSAPGGEMSALQPAAFVVTNGDYFEVMGSTLIGGRIFDERDTGDSEAVVIVNDALMSRFAEELGGEVGEPADAVGMYLSLQGDDRPRRIIGVVRATRHWGLERDPTPQVFGPYTQNNWSQNWVVLRTEGAPLVYAPAVHALMRTIDPEIPVYDIAPMEQRIADSLASRRTTMSLLATFALVALVQATLGIYGAAANWFVRRRQEIGIRIAIGASGAVILRQFLGAGARLTAIGIVLGLAAGAGLSRFIASLLFGVEPLDTLTIALTCSLIALVALAAILEPARRATRVDPIAAMRSE